MAYIHKEGISINITAISATETEGIRPLCKGCKIIGDNNRTGFSCGGMNSSGEANVYLDNSSDPSLTVNKCQSLASCKPIQTILKNSRN